MSEKNYTSILEELNRKYEEKKEKVEDIKVNLKSEEAQLNKLNKEIKEKFGREFLTIEELNGAIEEKQGRLELLISKVQDKLDEE